MQTPTAFSNKLFQLSVSAAVGAIAGSVVGYLIGKRNGDVFVVPAEAINERVEDTVVTPKSLGLLDNPNLPFKYMNQPLVMEPFVDPRVDPKVQQILDLAKDDPNALLRIQEDLAEQPTNRLFPVPDEEEYDEEVDPVTVFRIDDTDWDHEAELSTRSGSEPYVIHEEEYMANEMGYRQETINYYVGDDIMADPRDVPLYDHHSLMGDLKFGHGTKSQDLVYIRNENLRMEWEIIRNGGYFAVDVMGLQMDGAIEQEIKHAQHSVLKFRRD